MHPLRIALGLAALAGTTLGLVAALAPGAPAQDAAAFWRTDLETARREALESGKPLLVTFR